MEDPDTAISRHVYAIIYTGLPMPHKSKLQTECALSSTYSDYTGLSYTLHDAILVMIPLK